jgi:hypothetical protein
MCTKFSRPLLNGSKEFPTEFWNIYLEGWLQGFIVYEIQFSELNVWT